METNYPRLITYSEAVNGFVILFKGDQPTEDSGLKENMTLLSYNVLGDQLWKREIPLAGNVVQLFNLSDGYAVVGNYLQITDLAGKEFRTRMTEKEAGPYFIKVKSNGETSLIKPFPMASSLVTIRVVKVNDSSIHLLGFNGTLADQKTGQELGSHTMIDSNGQVIFSNVQ